MKKCTPCGSSGVGASGKLLIQYSTYVIKKPLLFLLLLSNALVSYLIFNARALLRHYCCGFIFHSPYPYHTSSKIKRAVEVEGPIFSILTVTAIQLTAFGEYWMSSMIYIQNTYKTQRKTSIITEYNVNWQRSKMWELFASKLNLIFILTKEKLRVAFAKCNTIG
jgi:hypothetical protein